MTPDRLRAHGMGIDATGLETIMRFAAEGAARSRELDAMENVKAKINRQMSANTDSDCPECTDRWWEQLQELGKDLDDMTKAAQHWQQKAERRRVCLQRARIFATVVWLGWLVTAVVLWATK